MYEIQDIPSGENLDYGFCVMIWYNLVGRYQLFWKKLLPPSSGYPEDHSLK
jgi:hypothetical protein